MLKDQLNTAIAALVAAISNQPSATNDVSATAGLSYSAMNGAHAKFGDHSGNIITDVMNGTAYHKLLEKNLTNAQQLFQSFLNGVCRHELETRCTGFNFLFLNGVCRHEQKQLEALLLDCFLNGVCRHERTVIRGLHS